ncbi:hypothetical protein MMC30_002274 [Trapelia coarctata]|nr:hypothetical protein [Trapelia coarctata]
MYYIRTEYCPHCSRYAEIHYYDHDEPIIKHNGRSDAFAYRGPALIQEIQTLIQYCDCCAKDPNATRYLKLGIPLDKFLEYCTDKEYAKRLEKTIAKLLDKARRDGQKGEIIDMAEIERDDQHFLQTMVTLQADGKRMLRGEDLGRRKRKEETAKKLQRWLSGIGRRKQQHSGQDSHTAPSTSDDAGRQIQVDEKSFWIEPPDRDFLEDENGAHQDDAHQGDAHQDGDNENHVHEADTHQGDAHPGDAHQDDDHEDHPHEDQADNHGTTKMSNLELQH